MASGNIKVCQFFASSSGGGCPYGAMCNFSHDLPSIPVSRSQAEAERNLAGSSREVVRRPCRYFRSGFCKDGSRCKFRHDEDSAPPQRDIPIQASPQRKPSKNICRFFLSPNGCHHGENCRFLHKVNKENLSSQRQALAEAAREEYQSQEEDARQSKEVLDNVNNTSDEKESTRRENSESVLASSNSESMLKRRPCRYFSSVNGCRLGNQCRFRHAKLDKSQPPNGTATFNSQSRRPVLKPNVQGGFLESNLKDLTEADQQKARETEIDILKKRYPQATEIPREKGGIGYSIKFSPTDPDWPYDVKSLDLIIYFPQLYPKTMMDVTIPEQDNLPETVRRCVMFAVEDWVRARFKNFEKKGRVERVFRPFLRWLDRDLEDIFTDALTHYKKELVAKAAGIEIIPARHLQARYQQDDDEIKAEEEEVESDIAQKTKSDEEDRKFDMATNIIDEPKNEEFSMNSNPLVETKLANLKLDQTQKGTEVKIRELQLGESVATLIAPTIKLIVRCTRCKEAGEINTPPERLNMLTCGKCNHSLLIKYRPAMMHGFSSILGYLDLEECTAFDLVLMDCDFLANCMNCNRDNNFGGIPPGQVKNTWCQSCHTKLTVAMEGVQFRQLQSAAIEKVETAHKVQGAKAIRNVRDPAIKEGKPLPDDGTCKHYKKSFRWLRFPCCGKTYPCDICHDTKEDHEMKFANRMVCGFCAHEQPFSALKPCSACNSSMTSKSTEHWEGGKGCRDVIRMSRNDDKKYSNLNKTVSRKSQSKSQPGKKNTKLRHT